MLEMESESLGEFREVDALIRACSLLLEIITCRAPVEALDLLLEDPHQVAERALLTGLMAWDYTPAFTVSQLASFMDLFIPFLEDNRESLARTGLPHMHFSACPWLDVVAPLYPSTPATWVWPPELAGPGGGPWLCHTTLKVLALRHCCSAEYRGCQCGARDVSAELAPDDGRRVEAGRVSLLYLKTAVLRRLGEAARHQCVDGLWDDCLRLLTRSLLTDDAEFWLRMDEVYSGAAIRNSIVPLSLRSNGVGGFSDLLRLIGWFEMNLTTGVLQANRKVRACLPRGGRPASYFDLASRPERRQLDQALDRLQSLGARSTEAWVAFGHKVNAALNGEFEEEVLVPVRVKRAVSRNFQTAADAWGNLLAAFANRGVPPSAFDPASGAVLPHVSEPRNQRTFPSPPGLSWEEVTFEFLSDTAVRVRAGGTAEEDTFAEFGFKDGRSAEKPDKLWWLLRVFARVNGELTWEMSQKLVTNIGLTPAAVKTSVKELRKRLRAVLGIKDDPFHPYRKAGGYRVKFTILDHDNREHVRPDEDDD
jgi:hypothetical protein